ncbi:MAG: tripartite tricarboxylate transporter TctB family protein [Pseudomonadota bacterium]
MKLARNRAGLAIGLGLVALGGVIATSISGMQVPPTYAKVGPRIFPFLAAGLLAGLGALFTLRALVGAADALQAEPGITTDWLPVVVISGGFLAFIALLEWAGFLPAAVALFLATAAGFGSRRAVRDLIAAIVVALAIYLLFDRILGLPLPAGMLKGLI